MSPERYEHQLWIAQALYKHDEKRFEIPELVKIDRYHTVSHWFNLLQHRKEAYMQMAMPLANQNVYHEEQLNLLKKELEIFWWKNAFHGGKLQG